jgi:hypothetical protein
MEKLLRIAIMLVFALSVGYATTRTIGDERTSRSGEISEPRKLAGKTVKNPQGENLGVITDIVAGPQGRTAFVVLSYWISDDTQKRVAIPFGVLSCDEENCVLHADKSALNIVPPFILEDDLAEPKLAEKIYGYFGLQPYWAEEGIQK